MRPSQAVFATLVVLIAWCACVYAQTAPSSSPRRDAQAIQVLTAAVAASGGTPQLTQVVDLTETGTITYNWANQNVTGTVRVLEIGTKDVRLDASLPSEHRRWFISAGQGKQDYAGRMSEIPYRCGVNAGALTLPILKLSDALKDPEFEITYLGTVEDNLNVLYHIRIRRDAGANAAERKTFHLESSEFFIDAKTHFIARVEDVARSEDGFTELPHVLGFSDYRNVRGLLIPFAVSEQINGSHTWSLQVDAATINSGLLPAALQF